MNREIELLQQELEQLKQQNRLVVRESENLKRRIVRLERDKQYSAITAANIERVRDFNAKEKETQHLYNQLLLSNCPDMIFVFDREFNFLLATEASSDFLHYSSYNDLINKSIDDVFGKRFPQTFLTDCKERCNSVMASGDPMAYEWNTAAEDRTLYLEITISPANNLEGACMGVVIVLHDVTSLTLLKDAAEKSSVAKSTFLATMSHEMRTPMNAIIGMASIAKGTDDIEKMRYCLDRIDNASTHLLGVINDILDISKIESGKFALSLSDFDLEEMLMRVINVQNFRIEEKKQTLKVKLAPDLPPYIHSDEQRLAQVITNLLSNAVKFTDDSGNGEITLSVSIAKQQGDNICLQVSVEDNGIGISAEQQERLFQSFSQADSGISRRFGGTGLGLVISKNIVSMMNGEIWLNSVAEKGSSFTFQVWVKKCHQPAPWKHTDLDWSLVRILAVDDQQDTLDYFQNIGTSIGLHCDVADSGEKALEVIRSAPHPYQVIFVDWLMPTMDGMELTRRIKQLCDDSTIVIMISATEWTQLEEEATSSGVDRFLPKPLFTSAVAQCIAECLNLFKDNAASLETTENTPAFAGKHILLAEDMDVNREIVIALLEDTGVVIDSAENGAVAVEMFTANPDRYDLIFMDIHMPVVDGYTATQQIRALDCEKAKTIPIVAMTANVFREDIEKCLACGMDDHVGKPIDIDNILLKLEKYL